LDDLLKTIVPVGRGQTTTLDMVAASGGTATWKSAADYYLTAIMPVAGSNGCCVSTDGTTNTFAVSAAANRKMGTILYCGGVANSQMPFELRHKISNGDTVSLVNNGASTGIFLLVLEII
jgi:hypothetical protein